MTTNSPDDGRQILTVTALNRLARNILTSEIGMVWLNAEISNFVAASSGHWYFTLKDNKAQVRAAMFKGNNRLIRFRPKEGDKVLVRASVGLYEPRGDYQLVVEHMQADGEGQLKLAFDALKTKLLREGLFAQEHKRPIPQTIRSIGLVTSAQGAALHDVLTVLKRRSPTSSIIIYPSLVQGDSAPAQLIQAIDMANARQEVDVILLTRGGGSMEDLWCFNDENLARCIFTSTLPIISAVGHEVDITIADFVADLRAPTPSAGAELVSRDSNELRKNIKLLSDRLYKSWLNIFQQSQHVLTLTRQQLQHKHPSVRLQQQSQYVDRLSQSLQSAMSRQLNKAQQQAQHSTSKLLQYNPKHQITIRQSQLEYQQKQLVMGMLGKLEQQKRDFANVIHMLHSVSPLATMQRGYSISMQEGKTITSVTQIREKSPMITKIHDGEIVSIIQSVQEYAPNDDNIS
jgi:exodeoxyribonuclease VII large subunit